MTLKTSKEHKISDRDPMIKVSIPHNKKDPDSYFSGRPQDLFLYHVILDKLRPCDQNTKMFYEYLDNFFCSFSLLITL